MEERRRHEDTRIDVLTERVENWMESTTEYRKSLCSKIDALNTKIDAMPCSQGHDMDVNRQLGAIWWIVSVCLVGVISVAMAWGAVNNQVATNTERWNRYLEDQSHEKSRISQLRK